MKWKLTLGIVALVLVVTPAAVALAQPQAAACALINYRGLDEVAPGVFASSDVTSDQRLAFARLHTAAKLRIANTFGAAHASPVIVIGSTEALRELFPGAGSYASTIFIPYRSCVLVGPNGHDVNIVAHEALHAEIHHRVGHWYRLTQIPTWFDEGLAMQVDDRERYVWSLRFGTVRSGTVRQWTSRAQFFTGDDDELTRHYAMAKEEVRQWVEKLGRLNVYGFLERVSVKAAGLSRFMKSRERSRNVSRICVVYHSAFGHTKAQADAVAAGARSVPDTEVHLIPVQQVDAYWEQLHAADALIFGTPTYMGTVSAEFKVFMDRTSQFWANQPWKDKLAAAFTNSGSQHGDKLNTLISLAVFAAQHGMHWINLGLLPGHNSSTGSAEELNRVGAFLGAMAQSNVDEGPDVAPPKSDRETAFHLGRRVADAARRWQQEPVGVAVIAH